MDINSAELVIPTRQMVRRVSRKSKKWHRKNGYIGPYFTDTGDAYWLKTYRAFRYAELQTNEMGEDDNT